MQTFTEIRDNSYQGGLSLVELMVALLLGVVLSLGAVNLFLQSKMSFLQDEQSARMQEGGRYAQRYLSRELSMAGFYGGILRGDDITSNLASGADNCHDLLAETSLTIEHWNNVVGTLPTPLNDCLSGTDTIVPGTDVLVIRRVGDSPHFLRDDDPTTPDIGSSTFDAGTAYLRLEDYNVSTTLETGNGFDATGSKPLAVWKYRPQLLFVRDWSVTDSDGVPDGVPALCRKEMISAGVMGPTTCLVEGVENLQVEFGIDTNDDYIPDRYLAAPTDAQLSFAMSARIYILMRSTDELAGYTNDKTYTLGSQTVPAQNDGLYRRLYQTSSILRNSEALGI